MTLAICLRNVYREFQEGRQQHKVLDGVDLQMKAGETVAIRGRSGSGKSTLLNIVSGIDEADSGDVLVHGRDIASMKEPDRTLFRRKHIGFVYQSFNLVTTLNVSDNLRLVLELNGVRGDKAESRIAELLSAVGMATRSGSYPDVLSGGEQQRVAIARALAHRPAVILADEPTGNLDELNAERVIELLESLSRNEGVTLVMATHSANVAAGCDRVLEMRGGRLQTAMNSVA